MVYKKNIVYGKKYLHVPEHARGFRDAPEGGVAFVTVKDQGENGLIVFENDRHSRLWPSNLFDVDNLTNSSKKTIFERIFRKDR